MYDIKLLQEGSLSKQAMILKYFYMIDPAQTIKELDECRVPQNSSDIQSVDIFFHTVFEKIYLASFIYSRYLNPPYNAFDAFFGEPGCTSNSNENYFSYTTRLEHMRIFLKLSFRNHCITQGFFNSLSKKNSDDHVFLSATYEKFLESGYFANPKYEKNEYNKVESGDGSHQKYNAKFRSLRKLGEDSFLWKTLIDSSLYMNESIPPTETRFNFKVPLVYKHWIYSFFMNTGTFTLSKHIRDSRKGTHELYRKLYTDQKLEENNLKHPLDKFIFHTMWEYYLGFSTISYINDLMGKIQMSAPNENNYLKRYRGQILESTLNRLSHCPMPYARHLFFAYALESLHYNESIECKYLSQPPDVTMHLSSMNAPFTDEERDAKGLQLIPKFFNTLNHITLPVLSSLWNVVLENLIDDKELLFELYKTYVASHDKLLTADFSILSFDDMADCCSENRGVVSSNDIAATFSLNALMEKLNFKNSSKPAPFLGTIFSQKQLSSMIRDFLRISQEPPEASSNAFHLFPTEKPKEEESSELKFFRFNRAKNIFDLFSSKW